MIEFSPCYDPGFPISPWYRTNRINRRVLSLQGSDARSRTTEGDTWWVIKKTVRFSSHSTAYFAIRDLREGRCAA